MPGATGVWETKKAAKNAISGRFPRSPLPWGRSFIEKRPLKLFSEVSISTVQLCNVPRGFGDETFFAETYLLSTMYII